MKQALIDKLKTYGYPVALQGTLDPEQAYPASFYTIWNTETADGSCYDNRPVSIVWGFTVYFYSTDPALVNEQMAQTVKDLRADGWIIDGSGYDAASDEPTHTGRAVDVLYLKKED